MESKICYEFQAQMWRDLIPGGWHFISLPKQISAEIRNNLKWQEQGWGRMKIVACMKDCEWNTAIWFDTNSNTYLLPVKLEIRKKTKTVVHEIIHVKILI